MKNPKNRTKFLRVQCGMCKATQDSLNAQCTACANPLYTNVTPEELTAIRDQVQATEQLIEQLEQGTTPKDSPYTPLDKLQTHYKNLKAYHYIPGMTDYIGTVRQVLLPYKVRIMQTTLKANIIFGFALLGFALIPFALGWPTTISLLMLLPAIVWLFLIYRAMTALKKARAELQSQP